MSDNEQSELNYFQGLASRWQDGSITPEEKELLDKWYIKGQEESLDIPDSFVLDESTHKRRIWKAIRLKILKRRQSRKNYNIYWRSIAAILILLIVSNVFWLLYKGGYTANKTVVVHAMRNDVAPGQYGAVLHLSNGKTILLDSQTNGTVAIEKNVKIIKENGTLKYVGKVQQDIYNDISTGRGKVFKIILPDGTMAWLNAASSIHYPLVFTGRERTVEITGEVYFDVVHDASHPFKVKAAGQIIEDIGTVFDVNAYEDEKSIKTTLLKGAVRVNNIILKPGQQLRINNKESFIKEVNTDNIIAWVNGQLSMEDISLQELMRQLSRWYDVDIVYEGKIPATRFGGIIDRSVYLSNIINVLNEYGIKIKLEDKKLIVSPK